MEVVAEPYNRDVRGLWRRPRNSDGRPGSITGYILRQKLPFTPLTRLARKVVLNPRCGKARTGTHTFDPPHVGPTLRELLERAGHRVPEAVPGDVGVGSAGRGIYREDCRGPGDSGSPTPATDLETEQHLSLVEDI